MKLVLLGDGESPHLEKWARALATRVDLWAASSRGFSPGLAALLPEARRLALGTAPDVEGGNAAVLRTLPRLAAWLKSVRADWIHAHYLTSHGTLAWLATGLLGAPGRIVGSAWGSDILVAPQRSLAVRLLTRRVLRACALATSDSQVMADRMRELGAHEVMVFPFGLEALPPAATQAKDDALFFANRGLEGIYRPQRVLEVFAEVARAWPQARLVVANDGTLRAALEARATAPDLAGRVQFVGRVAPDPLARWYDAARWYLSLPSSDSVAVSVLEAMAHGCVPLLSDLPANRELVRDGENGLIVAEGEPLVPRLEALRPRADALAAANRGWVAEYALFPPAVDRFVARLAALQGAGA